MPHHAPSPPRTHISLTHDDLDISAVTSQAKHPSAGALVTFAGTTRAFSRPAVGRKRGADGSEGGVRKKRRIHGSNRGDVEGEVGLGGGAHEDEGLAPEYKDITSLTYHAYVPLALKTMREIAETAVMRWGGEAAGPLAKQPSSKCAPDESARKDGHSAEETGVGAARTEGGLVKVVLAHRLGEVPVGEESVVVCVSAVHRRTAFEAAEWCLERVKERAEIWKWEEFVGEGNDKKEGEEMGKGKGMWRSNAVDSDMNGGRSMGKV